MQNFSWDLIIFAGTERKILGNHNLVRNPLKKTESNRLERGGFSFAEVVQKIIRNRFKKLLQSMFEIAVKNERKGTSFAHKSKQPPLLKSGYSLAFCQSEMICD